MLRLGIFFCLFFFSAPPISAQVLSDGFWMQRIGDLDREDRDRIAQQVLNLGETLDREGEMRGKSCLRAFERDFFDWIGSEDETSGFSRILFSPSGEVAGFLLARWDRHIRSVRVHKFGIDSRWRGRGFGTLLMRDLAVRASLEDRPKIALDVLSSNDDAIRLYRSLGFTFERVGPSKRPPAALFRLSVTTEQLRAGSERRLGRPRS